MVLLFKPILLIGQQKQVPKIKIEYAISAKTYPDSIVLRWAPLDPTALQPHIEAGVWIEKLTVSGKPPYQRTAWTKVNTVPIKPATIETFKNEKSLDEYEVVAAQLLYGDFQTPSNNTTLGIDQDQVDMLKSLFSLTLLGCDLSKSAAHKMGLRYTTLDKIKDNEKIFIRVFSAYDHPAFVVDTAMTFCTYGEWNVDDSPKFLTIQSREAAVELNWPYNKELHRWSAFNIERSTDGKTFKRLNKKPYLIISDEPNGTLHYIDSVVNYVPYHYRVEALDPFGESAGYTETVIGYGVDATPPPSIVLTEKSINGQKLELKWAFENNASCPDLKHFVIKSGKAIHLIHDTVQIVSKNTFSYLYNKEATTRSTFFEIVAVDTAGNVTSSNPVRYFIPDTEPPKPPVGLKANINAQGIVTLTWDEDPTDELVGYRVYRTNDKSHEMVCLQQGYLDTNGFTDTLELRTLTKDVYYAVCAVDLSYNHSKKSEIIKLIKPDIIPPFPPQFTHYEVKEKMVRMEWSPSPSDDVSHYILRRKSIDANSSPRDMVISKTALSYDDQDIQPSAKYEYVLLAQDSTALVSDPSFPLFIKTYQISVQEEIVLSWLDPEERSTFKWNSLKQEPAFYIIYKNQGDGFVQYSNVDGKSTQFNDPKWIKDEKVTYGLQAVMISGLKSNIFRIN